MEHAVETVLTEAVENVQNRRHGGSFSRDDEQQEGAEARARVGRSGECVYRRRGCNWCWID